MVTALQNSKPLIHPENWQHLLTLIERQRLHPAWLLTGIQGIGKASFAKEFARYLMLEGQANRGFAEMMLAQNIHPNLLTIEKGLDEDGEPCNEITVHHVRKLAEFVQHSPAVPGWRVVIIDAVDDLNRNAANALLKILEEPPTQTLIFLISHALGAVLPTIRSRCCLMPFKELTTVELGALAPQAPALALSLAGGSYGRLQMLLDVDSVSIFNDCLMLMQSALKNTYSQVTQYVAALDKKDPKHGLILEVIQWLLYRMICLLHGEATSTAEDQKILTIATQRPAAHWVKAYESYSQYLKAITDGHLDAGHVLLGALLIIENPLMAKEF